MAGWLMQWGMARAGVFYVMAVPMAIGALCVFMMGRRYGSTPQPALREAAAE